MVRQIDRLVHWRQFAVGEGVQKLKVVWKVEFGQSVIHN